MTTPTSTSTRPRSSSTRPAASTSTPRSATRPTAATSRSSPSSPGASRRASRSGSRCASCCSPVEIKGEGKVESIVIGRNELFRDDDGAIRARDTGEREELECGLVLRSIGYRGVGLEGLPFDERRATIANEGGRGIDRDDGEPGAGPVRRRLDQARPERRDRHQQEGLAGDRRRDFRGPGGREHSRAREPAGRDRSRSCSPSASRSRQLRRLAGDRRGREERRRAARPPAGQVLPHRRDGRGVPPAPRSAAESWRPTSPRSSG